MARTSTAPADTARQRNRRGSGDRLRTELLEAAEALVVEAEGPAALTLRAVAARAGVAATSVYLHFPDLAALKVTLAQRCFAAFAAARDKAAAGIDDPFRALAARARAYVDYALAHPGPYRLMFAPDLPLLMATGPGPSREAFEALVGSVRRCVEAGATPVAADPVRVATLVWTALHGQAGLRMDRPAFPWPPLDETIADLVAAFVRPPA